MATFTLRQLNTEVLTLKQNMDLLRSFLISIVGRDKEGEYNAKFVKEMEHAAAEKPDYSFQGADSFLTQLQEV